MSLPTQQESREHQNWHQLAVVDSRPTYMSDNFLDLLILITIVEQYYREISFIAAYWYECEARVTIHVRDISEVSLFYYGYEHHWYQTLGAVRFIVMILYYAGSYKDDRIILGSV